MRYASAPMSTNPPVFERLQHRVAVPDTEIELAVTEWCGAAGERAPLALLHHANGFCGAMWSEVVEPLLDRFRVFAIDARGHGDSSEPEGDAAYNWNLLADDLSVVGRWIVRHAGATNISLGVGHSFGGVLTMAAAANNPDLYERAILIDPVIIPTDIAELRARMGENPMSERARKRRHHWDSRDAAFEFLSEKPLFAEFGERAMRLYVDEALREAAQGGVELKCPGRVEGAIFGNSPNFDPYDFARRAKIPIRLVRATRGDFSRDSYERVVELLEHGELRDLEGGHLVPMEDPAAVIAEILEFVDSSESGD